MTIQVPNPNVVVNDRFREDPDFIAKAKTARFGRVYQSVDKVLNPDVIRLAVVDDGYPAPAWSDGTTITINAGMMPPLHGGTRLDLATWIGINAHEVAHTIHSPRMDSPLMVRVLATRQAYPNLLKIHNMVADQRDERLLIAQFPPLKVYLLAATRHFFGKMPSQGSELNWALLTGRTWLDPAIRRAYRDAYPLDPDEITRLIGEYQRLGDPGVSDADRAYDILLEIDDIFDLSSEEPPQGCTIGGSPSRLTEGYDSPAVADDDVVPSAGSDEDPIDDGEDADGDGDDADDGAGTQRTSEDDADSDAEGDDAEGDGDGDGEADGADGDGAEGDGADGESGDGDADGDGDGEAEGDGQGTGDGGTSDGGTDDTSDGDAGQGAGDGTVDAEAQANAPDWSELAEQLADQIMDELLNDSDSRSELDRLKQALNKAVQQPERLDITPKQMTPVTKDLTRTSVHLTKVFQQFTDAAQAYWERHTDSGKINVRRYLEADRFDPETGFDRFEPGMLDDLSLEVVVLLDRSASMGNGEGSLSDRASQAAWTIRRAVHGCEGTCTLVAYDTEATLLADGDKRPFADRYESMARGGGTIATGAAEYAWKVFNGSDATHKLLIALTDGDWQGGGPVVGAMRGAGVTTVGVLLLDEYEARLDAMQRKRILDRTAGVMQTEYTSIMQDPMDMVTLFKEIAVQLMKKATANAATWR